MPIGIPLTTRSPILVLVQQFCKRTNLPVPASVVGSAESQVKQLLALLEEEGNDLASRGSWQGLVHEATLTTVATESQGPITDRALFGFRYIKNGTLWDRTTRIPIEGPLTDQEWQHRKALSTSSGPRYWFRLRGGNFLVHPAPPAGLTWAFEYVSEYWLLSRTGSEYKAYATLDTDTCLLPESLLLMGLRWRWLAAKGFDYAEVFRTYENQVKDALGRDGGKRVLSMDEPYGGHGYGVFVPSGTWMQ